MRPDGLTHAHALMAALLVAVLAAACGGGGRLSTLEFRREASHICQRVTSRARATTIPPLAEHAAAAHTLEALSTRDRDAIRRLDDLKAPKDEADGTDEWIALLDQMVDEIDLAREELRAGNTTSASDALDRAAVLQRRAAAKSRARGITSCELPRLAAA